MPLLERAKFAAIFSQNLDEFFQVRVAGLKDQVAAGHHPHSARRPDASRAAARSVMIGSTSCHERARAGVPRRPGAGAGRARASVLSSWDELDDRGLASTWSTCSRRRIFPVLTPLAVDPGHPFPYISNLSLNLAVMVRDPSTGERRFARVKVPPVLPRFVVLPDGERFVPARAGHRRPPRPALPRHGRSSSTTPFRVTRNADLTLEEEEADDLLAAVEMELRRRRFGRAVRLEIDARRCAPRCASC